VIYFHKILPFFVLPLGLTFIFVIAGIVFRRWLFCAAGLVLLWVSAMPVTSDLVMRAVEGWEVRLPVARELGETSLMFPVHPTLKEEDMKAMADVVKQVMTEASL
jgi:hypothetical protein